MNLNGESLIRPEDREAIWDRVTSGAEALRDIEWTRSLAEQSAIEMDWPTAREWSPLGYISGPQSLALFFDQIDVCLPTPDWSRVSFAYVQRTVDDLQRIPFNAQTHPGLASGLAGTIFAIDIISRNNERYTNLTRRLDDMFFTLVNHADPIDIGDSGPISTARYDLISGIVGIGIVALQRQHVDQWQSILDRIVDILVTRSLGSDRGNPEFFSRQDQLSSFSRDDYPYGNWNCGVAHGIPGVMSFLALYVLETGNRDKRIQEAIVRLKDWILAHADYRELWPSWPNAISPHGQVATMPVFGWCYGSAGIIHALWLASKAIRSDDLRNWCLGYFRKASDVSIYEWLVRTPILCHGFAGAIQILLRVFHDTNDAHLQSSLSARVRELIELYDPSAGVLGYRNRTQTKDVTTVGILEGAAGVFLTLLAAGTSSCPKWDRALLLS